MASNWLTTSEGWRAHAFTYAGTWTAAQTGRCAPWMLCRCVHFPSTPADRLLRCMIVLRPVLGMDCASFDLHTHGACEPMAEQSMAGSDILSCLNPQFARIHGVSRGCCGHAINPRILLISLGHRLPARLTDVHGFNISFEPGVCGVSVI